MLLGTRTTDGRGSRKRTRRDDANDIAEQENVSRGGMHTPSSALATGRQKRCRTSMATGDHAPKSALRHAQAAAPPPPTPSVFRRFMNNLATPLRMRARMDGAETPRPRCVCPAPSFAPACVLQYDDTSHLPSIQTRRLPRGVRSTCCATTCLVEGIDDNRTHSTVCIVAAAVLQPRPPPASSKSILRKPFFEYVPLR